MIRRSTAETAAVVSAVATAGCGVLLFKSGILFSVSIASAHNSCQTAGAFIYLGGAAAVTACDHAVTSYNILMPLFFISIVAVVGALALILTSETAAIREARKGNKEEPPEEE